MSGDSSAKFILLQILLQQILNRIFLQSLQYIVNQMFSFLRPMSAYSRLLFQQERKHQNIYQFLHTSKTMGGAFNLFAPFISNKAKSSLQPSVSNLAYDLSCLPLNSNFLDVTQAGNRENQTNFIQYEANNGIQDRIVFSDLNGLKAQFIGVYDGHGGDKLSDYCQKHIVGLVDGFLQQNLKQKKYENKQDQLIIDSLLYAYSRIQKDFYDNVYLSLVATNNRKIKNVGTCALSLIIYEKKVYVANCGDSEAIIVSKNKNGQIAYRELNQRLSVNNPKQRERLIEQFPHDSDIVIQESQGSYYLKGRLQPTRSLGDYHLKYSHLYKGKGKFNGPYINSSPAINVFQIKEDDQSIVVASDGVWDFLDKKTVSSLSLECNPEQEILDKTLQKVAQSHKITVEELKLLHAIQKRSFHDDISILVTKLGRDSKPTHN